MRRFRRLGLPAAAALGVLLLALTAGPGFAHRAAAPSNTNPPTISGKAQVGQLLKADNGTWNGTTPFTYAFQWRVCDQNGAACHDIAGATGNEYTLKPDDQGNAIRVQVTAKNAEGSDAAASVPTAAVTAAPSGTPAPTPSGNGCGRQTQSAKAVPIANIASPVRLLVDQVQSSPGVITAGTDVFTVRVHVSDTCGDMVQGAEIFATGVPYNMVSIPSRQQTDDQGWVSMQFRTLRGFPATTHQRLMVLFVRASKPGEPILAGVSTRRLVSLHVNLNG
jgi:hypothetical protein